MQAEEVDFWIQLKKRRIRTAGFTPCWASARLFVPADRCYRRQSHGRRAHARAHRHAQLSGNHIGWRSINHYSQSDFTACILVQYDRKIFIYLSFASLVLLVIDIISDVISMSGSRLIVSVWVKVCVRCIPECPLRPDQTLFEQFFLWFSRVGVSHIQIFPSHGKFPDTCLLLSWALRSVHIWRTGSAVWGKCTHRSRQ